MVQWCKRTIKAHTPTLHQYSENGNHQAKGQTFLEGVIKLHKWVEVCRTRKLATELFLLHLRLKAIGRRAYLCRGSAWRRNLIQYRKCWLVRLDVDNKRLDQNNQKRFVSTNRKISRKLEILTFLSYFIFREKLMFHKNKAWLRKKAKTKRRSHFYALFCVSASVKRPGKSRALKTSMKQKICKQSQFYIHLRILFSEY